MNRREALALMAAGAGAAACGPEGAANYGDAGDLPHAWARFEFEREAAPGEHILQTRATDAAGETQPLGGVFNEKGYLLDVALPHTVQVG